MDILNIQLPSTPYKKILATNIDYYKLFLSLERKNINCYLFESLSDEKRQDSQTSFGFNPLFTVKAKSNTLYFEGNLQLLGVQSDKLEIQVDNPYYYLRKFFPNYLSCKTREGGLIGYVSYEAINYFEPALNLIENSDFYQFQLGFYDHGLIYHSKTQELEYYYYLEDRSEEVLLLLNQLRDIDPFADDDMTIQDQGTNLSRDEYDSLMDEVFCQIKAGNTFQIEIGQKNKYYISGRKIKIYDQLRIINPSPYMIYIKIDNNQIMGASPEILISSINNYVVTTPTAGTFARGDNDVEDDLFTKNMLSDIKEIAEHTMLVDLHRNDLGKIAEIGSVKVEELMHVIKFSHVQHIVSKITCIKAQEYDCFDVLASICPGGVLTGVPKIETMKIISKIEKESRGPYGGAVGRFSFNGDCAFALPIRTLFCSKNNCFTQTSSGVVVDSNVEKEFQEIQNKLAAMKLAIYKSM